MTPEARFRVSVVLSFYDRLEKLRDALTAAGLESWGGDLLAAERSASTSGEAIDSVGVVLRRLDASSDLQDEDLREKVRSVLAEGSRIWNSTT
jgi:hypothetical protein